MKAEAGCSLWLMKEPSFTERSEQVITGKPHINMSVHSWSGSLIITCALTKNTDTTAAVV